MRHANELRHVGTLQQFVATGADAHGQPTGSWSPVASVRLKIEPLTGRASEYAHQFYDLATHTLWLRYRENVSTDNRLVIGTRTFHFGYVENFEEMGRWLRILASEVV